MSSKKSEQFVRVNGHFVKAADEMVGKEFGFWLVLRRALSLIPSHQRSGAVTYLCECQCEYRTRRVIAGTDLRRGHTNSCRTCYGVRRRINAESALLSNRYTKYRLAARAKQTPFELTAEEFAAIAIKPCFYCGEGPFHMTVTINTGQSASRKGYKPLIYSGLFTGIDRYDNALGYTRDNSVPCCREHNYLKSDRHGDDFLAHIRRIAAHQDWLKEEEAAR